MSPNLATRAIKFYQREGLWPLLDEVDKRIRALAPFRYRLAYRRWISKRKYGVGAIRQPLRIYYINPEQITRSCPRFSRSKYIGTDQGGDWDENTSEWGAGGSIYKGLSQRFDLGYDWPETQYYRNAKERIKRDGYYLGYTDFSTFRTERLSYLDQMYEDIKRNGYRTQTEIENTDRDENRHEGVTAHHLKTHEIGCNIGRDGELLFNSGNHRLSIAKILDLDQIPIQIIVRHSKWMEMRRRVVGSATPKQTACEQGIDPAHQDISYLISDTG